MRKKLYKKILMIFILVLCFTLLNENMIFAALSEGGAIQSGIFEDILKAIANVGISASFAALAGLVSLLAVLLFIIIQTIFAAAGVTASILAMPFPDVVIFNRLPFFDPNFINPDPEAPTAIMKGIIANMYDSFVVIAIAMFIVIAMIIGIKLAISSIATEKAKYKQAILTWVMGILILLSMKWIIAGIFLINEQIVSMVFNISLGEETEFKVLSLNNIPLIGSTIETIFNFFGSNSPEIGGVNGYLGFTLKFLLEGIGGNIISSIVAFVVLGQTISIIVTYTKRVFYSIMLGMLAPLIVVADTINKSLGKSSTILSNWFKQFVITVFIQTFHAMFMLIILMMIKAIAGSSFNSMMQAVIIIALTTALVKFEKTIKQLFGIGDTIMGDLKGGAAKALGAIHGAKQAIGAVGDNVKNYKTASSQKKKLTSQRAKLLAQKPSGNSVATSSGEVTSEGASVTSGGTQNQSSGQSGISNDDKVVNAINNLTEQMREASREEKIAQLDVDIAKEATKMSSARLASILGPANLVAGLGIGIGSADDFQGALLQGGYITKGLDSIAEKIGERGSKRERQGMYLDAKEDGRENKDILYKGRIKFDKSDLNPLKQLQNHVINPVIETKAIIKGDWSGDLNKALKQNHKEREKLLSDIKQTNKRIKQEIKSIDDA